MLKLLFAVSFPLLVFVLVVAVGAVDGLVELVIDYSFSGRSANPWIAAAVYPCMGAVIGFETVDLLPHRLFPVRPPFPGISLLLAPLGAGLLMHCFGLWRRKRAHDSSWLSTFWGGAVFAFSIALSRWITVAGR